jgi:hypothetical protein
MDHSWGSRSRSSQGPADRGDAKEDVMTTEQRVVEVEIEISEEAYKQNTVYRPWSDIQAGIRATNVHAPIRLERPRNLHRPVQQ